MNPSFLVNKWGFMGSVLYRHVFVMVVQEVRSFLETRHVKHIYLPILPILFCFIVLPLECDTMAEQ